MSLKAWALVPAVLLGLASSSASAQPEGSAPSATATLRGRIIDSQSREPIGQAEVAVIRTGPHAFTGDDGRFVLERVPAGACTLSVTRLGYAPVRRELTLGEGTETT